MVSSLLQFAPAVTAGTSPGMTKQELISAAMNLLRDRRLGGREEYLSPVIPGRREASNPES
jgi:hypothetical protein